MHVKACMVIHCRTITLWTGYPLVKAYAPNPFRQLTVDVFVLL